MILNYLLVMVLYCSVGVLFFLTLIVLHPGCGDLGLWVHLAFPEELICYLILLSGAPILVNTS